MKQTPGEHREREVDVWDLPVRVFHWALVILLTSQVVTASVGGNAMEYHVLGGYAVLTLVVFRIVWGLAGSRHARFSDFVHGPRAVLAYAKSLLGGGHEQHLGHNPLGGWSVVLMLISLLVQTATGLFADDEVMTTGPLAKHVSDEVVSLCSEIHEINAGVLAALVCIHVAAVLYYLIAQRENLIVPMITGRKPWPRSSPGPAARNAGLARALVILIVSGLAVAGLVNL
jgi:cytochrome b